MDTIEIYMDAQAEYRWHKKASNGEIIADSGESYTRKDDAMKAAEREKGETDARIIFTENVSNHL